MRSYGIWDWLLARPFREAQPTWSRKLGLFVGLPAWLGWGYAIVSGEAFAHQALSLIFFGIFATVGLVQNFYFFVRPVAKDDWNG